MKTINHSKLYGFSMIELIVVLAIIAILAVALVGIGDHMKKKAYATHIADELTQSCAILKEAYSAGATPMDATQLEQGSKYGTILDTNAKDVDGNSFAVSASGNVATITVVMSHLTGAEAVEMLPNLVHAASAVTIADGNSNQLIGTCNL